MITQAFVQLATLNAAKRGMPHIRIAYTPHPVAGKTAEQLWQYVEGPDPVSGKPLMKEIADDLTRPLTAEDTKTGRITPDTGPATYTDTADGLQELYLNNGMTDFLPIIIPTEERVDAMLKGTSHAPDELVGKMAGCAYVGCT